MDEVADDKFIRCMDALMKLHEEMMPGRLAGREERIAFLKQWGESLLCHAAFVVNLLVGNGRPGAPGPDEIVQLSDDMVQKAKRAMIGAAGDRGQECMKVLQSWLN
jgi:hypothetical protein